jgi:hypothetical protein
MSYDFKKLMSEKNDEEILAVVASNEGDYVPEAMQAAKEEFVKRGLSSTKLAEEKLKLDYYKKVEMASLKDKNTAVGVILWLKIGTLLLLILGALISWWLNK